MPLQVPITAGVMDPLIGGALIGAGGQVLGSLIQGRSDNRAARQQNAQNQAAMQFARQEARRSQQNWERAFRRSGIANIVTEARAAGISPLAALGASSPAAPPSVPVPPQGSVRPFQSPGAAVVKGMAGLMRDYYGAQVEREQLQNDFMRVNTAKVAAEADALRARTYKAYIDSQIGQRPGGPPLRGMYSFWRNNIDERPPGTDLISASEELAESLEGLGALAVGATGNAQAGLDLAEQILRDQVSESWDLPFPIWR